MLLMLVTLLLCFLFGLAVFRRRRAPAPAARRQRTIKIRDAAVARRALIDHADVFSNRPAALFAVPLVTGLRRRRSDNILSVPYGSLWRALRCNLTVELLHPTRLASIEPLQRDAVESLVADVADRSAGEVVVVRERIRAAVFPLVVRLCFGDGLGEHQLRELQRLMKDFVLAIGDANRFPGKSWPARLLHWTRLHRLRAFRRRQADYFLRLIAARRQTRHTDDGVFRPYVDSLLDLRVPDADNTCRSRRALTDDEMVSLVSEFLGAGTETVVSCVEWTLAHLVIEPEAQDKLHREVIDGERHRVMLTPYLRAVMLESLRLHPPVPLVMRYAHAASPAAEEMTGLPLPAGGGARMHFMVRDIGRDGKAWTEPNVFRPERFMAGGEAEGVGPLPGPKEMRMMPFAAGRRSCPGMGIGMAHVGLIVAALVREFEWAPAAAARGRVDLTELDGFFKTMRTPLRARATPRHARPRYTTAYQVVNHI
uniref:Cytochrome P450 n=1 Tax=Oryza punctata TaxID=4537 RepID=A0A0E0KMD3_ORYPU